MTQVKGVIEYHGLSDWWQNEITTAEKEIILTTYNPMGSSPNEIIEANICFSSGSAVQLVGSIASWLNKIEHIELAKKLFVKAENLINSRTPILDVHFLFQNEIITYYKHREVIGLEPSITSCNKQISISKKASRILISEYGMPLPSHKGYQQLSIIMEKLSDYQKVIAICNEAKNEGWSGDWDKRIERCTKKQIKLLDKICK
ncbi:hypothetical protein Q7I15_05695 [Aeromonas veronii]|jgi:hypothetical protein|nr:hypothetical protein [Aeromonas caviae]MDX7764601.1 hypothetical protein [Aeromonas caviae]